MIHPDDDSRLDEYLHPGNDPQRPPPKKPGDVCILFGPVAGFMGGGILGLVVGWISGGGPFPLLHVFAGGMMGGLAVTVIGDSAKRRRISHRRTGSKI
jgi:hypothetical protein